LTSSPCCWTNPIRRKKKKKKKKKFDKRSFTKEQKPRKTNLMCGEDSLKEDNDDQHHGSDKISHQGWISERFYTRETK